MSEPTSPVSVEDAMSSRGMLDLEPHLAAIIVGHGERGRDFSNAILQNHAKAVSERLGNVPVFAGVLSGLPTIEAALGKAVNTGARRILVYPYFMAAGFFVSTRVPQRIAGAGASERCRMLGPLGADPGLPALVLRRAAAVAVDNLDQPARACRLLLVGHGSKVARASAEATEAVAAALRRAGEFASIETAFLEEAPFLDDVIGQDAEGRDARPTVIVGLFNGDGLHAGEDVPAAMQKAKGPVAYTGAVGAMPEVADLIAVAIETAAKELRADVLA